MSKYDSKQAIHWEVAVKGSLGYGRKPETILGPAI